MDEPEFSVELDLAKRAKNEETKILFPTREDFEHYRSSQYKSAEEWLKLVEAAFRRGPITARIAPFIFGPQFKMGVGAVRKMADTLEKVATNEIYGISEERPL